MTVFKGVSDSVDDIDGRFTNLGKGDDGIVEKKVRRCSSRGFLKYFSKDG